MLDNIWYARFLANILLFHPLDGSHSEMLQSMKMHCWTKAALLILTVMGRLKLLILLMNFKNCNVCKACTFNAARKWFQVTAKLSIVCICVKRAEVSLKRNEVITWVKNLNPIKNSLYLMETLFPLPSVSHKNSLFQK